MERRFLIIFGILGFWSVSIYTISTLTMAGWLRNTANVIATLFLVAIGIWLHLPEKNRDPALEVQENNVIRQILVFYGLVGFWIASVHGVIAITPYGMLRRSAALAVTLVWIAIAIWLYWPKKKNQPSAV